MDSTSSAGGRNAVAAVLFMQAGMTVFDTYSTLNSSPWTAENVGADPEKMRSLREYVTHAALFSTGMCVAAGIIAGSAWPIWGAVVSNSYLVWIYKRAADRGKAAGSDGANWFGAGGWGGKSA